MPTGVNVGGINIALGVDTSRVVDGLEDAKKTIAAYVGRIGNQFKRLNLEGSITGNPFSTTQKFLKETSGSLKTMFDFWATGIDKTSNMMGKFAAKSKSNLESVAKEYGKVIKRIQRYSGGGEAAGEAGKTLGETILANITTDEGLLSKLQDMRLRGAGGKFGKASKFDIARLFGFEGGVGQELKLKAFTENLQEGLNSLKSTVGRMTPEMKKVQSFIDSLTAKTGTAMTYKEARKYIDETVKGLNKLGTIGPEELKKIEKAYKAMEEVIRRGYLTEKGIQQAFAISAASSSTRALEARKKAVVDNIISEKRLQAQIEARFDVEKSRSKLIGVLERRKEITGYLPSSKEDQLRLLKQQRFQGELGRAGSEEQTTEAYTQQIQKLKLKEAHLKTALRLGLDEKNNTAQLVKLYEQWLSITGRLSREQAQALTSGKASILSGEWKRAGDPIAISEKYRSIVQSLIVEERRLRKEIEMGYDVEKNRAKLRSSIERRQEITGTLPRGVKAELEIQKMAEYGAALGRAKNLDLLETKRIEQIRKAAIMEEQARTAIRENFNVEANRGKLYDALNMKKQAGILLSRQETRELKNMQAAVEAARNSSTELFSPQWFRSRVMWFVQLRTFWEVWRLKDVAVNALLEFHSALARVMRTARDEMSSNEETVRKYSKALADASASFNVSFKTVGEALYQLGSAGLKTDEQLAALNTSLGLSKALEGEIGEATRVVASIYNNYNKELGETLSVEEKMTKIGDMLTIIYNDHLVELPELIEGFKYISATGKLANLSLAETVGILGVLNDHMIKGSQTGRTFNHVIMKMVSQPRVFKKAFGVDNTLFDPSKPLEMMKIMGELSRKLKNTEITAYDLAGAFDKMDMVGARTFVTALQYWDEIENAVKKADKAHGDLAQTVEVRMKNMSDAWGRFFKTLTTGLASDLSPAMDKISAVLNIFSEAGKLKRSLDVVKSLKVLERVKGLESYTEIAKSLSDSQVKDLEIAAEYYSNMLEEVREYKGIEKGIEVHLKRVLKARENLVKIERQRKTLEDKTRSEELKPYKKGPASIEDLEARWRLEKDADRKILDIQANMAEKRREIAEQQEIVNKLEEKAAREGGVNEAFIAGQVKAKEDLVVLTQELNRLEGALNTAIGDANQKRKTAVDLSVNEKEARIKANQNAMQTLQLEADTLMQREVTEVELKRLLEIYDEINRIEKNSAERQLELNYLKEREGTIAYESYKNANLEADAREKGKRSSTQLKYIGTLIERETTELKRQIGEKQQLLTLYEIENEDQEKIVEVEKEILELNLKSLATRLEWWKTLGPIETKEQEINKILSERNEQQTEITKNAEKWRRATDPVYDAYRRMQESMKGLKTGTEIISETVFQGSQTAVSGLTKIGMDVTGGFQEQRQEIINLEAELENLQKEYDDAMSQGDVERIYEINKQMENLRDNISDLKSPLKTVGEMFRVFFKDLVDEMRQVIIRALAMKVVLAAIGAVSGSAPVNSDYAVGPGWTTGATGGVFPHIQAFRRFSKGGMTSRPSLALLGDNKSGAELVIPSENIEKDHVSGYVRNKEAPINVINVITDDDLYEIMGRAKGQKIIVNTIGNDMRRGGTTMRSYNM